MMSLTNFGRNFGLLVREVAKYNFGPKRSFNLTDWGSQREVCAWLFVDLGHYAAPVPN